MKNLFKRRYVGFITAVVATALVSAVTGYITVSFVTILIFGFLYVLIALDDIKDSIDYNNRLKAVELQVQQNILFWLRSKNK